MDATLATTQTQALTPFLGPLEVKMINKSLENGPIESNAHVAIAFDVLESKNKLNNLVDTVKDGGFILLSETNNISQTLVENSNLILISKLSADGRTFYLLRKVCLNYMIINYFNILINYRLYFTFILLVIVLIFFLAY